MILRFASAKGKLCLHIDTKDQKIVIVILLKDGRKIYKLTEENKYGSQVLLPLIKKILTKNKLKFEDLKEIKVETGPGSYTGLKVGAAVANALGFSLGIPVNGKEMEVELKY